MSEVPIQIGGDMLYISSTLIKVMLFISWNPISLYWEGILIHTVFQFLYTSDLISEGKLQKILQHISHSHAYVYFAHPDAFFALPIKKQKQKTKKQKNEFIRYGFSLVWFVVLILIRANLEQSINNKMVSKT